MQILSFVLWPIIRVMEFILDSLHALTGSYGLSIICLSIIVRVVISPISGLGKSYAEKDRIRLQEMQPAIVEARAKFSGRERFEHIDEIYKQFGYHPIHSMASLIPLIVQIPFLLAALLLLVGHPPLAGVPFLVIPDLSRPDALLAVAGTSINVVPLVLTAAAILESFTAANATRSTRMRFLIVALVLVVLIYPLPSGVCLYWLTSNVWSLLSSALRRS